MALIAIAADKGSPGVTTASIALAAVWPRPVLLAECDPAGGDLVYRFPAAGGGRLGPHRGLLSLAVAARRGLQPQQVWEHVQKLHGGLDILAGVSGAEQGAGLELFWNPVGQVLAAVPEADVIADCGRIGVDGPLYDLLAHAACVVLLSRPAVGEVIRLRGRIGALSAALQRRGRIAPRVGVVVVADLKDIPSAVGEVGQALRTGGAPGRVIGGLAHEPRSAEQLRGAWGGRLDKSMFIRTARAIAADLAGSLPEVAAAARPSPVPAVSPDQPGQPATAPGQPDQPASAPGQPDQPDQLASASGQPASPSGQPVGAPGSSGGEPTAGLALGPAHHLAGWAQPNGVPTRSSRPVSSPSSPAPAFRGRHAAAPADPFPPSGDPFPPPAHPFTASADPLAPPADALAPPADPLAPPADPLAPPPADPLAPPAGALAGPADPLTRPVNPVAPPPDAETDDGAKPQVTPLSPLAGPTSGSPRGRPWRR